jgi:hypothetical protein
MGRPDGPRGARQPFNGPEFESAVSEEEIIRRTVAVMEQYNITGVVSASATGVYDAARFLRLTSAASSPMKDHE